ncbi:MAG TPA: hypothetical protein VFD64_12880 [Gemmatimonadaceae bacterium]|nr:hypothetical protein [Gemmatimonadaceae bacterium]
MTGRRNARRLETRAFGAALSLGCKHGELPAFLAMMGLAVATVHARGELASELGVSGDETKLAEGEYVVVAEDIEWHDGSG